MISLRHALAARLALAAMLLLFFAPVLSKALAVADTHARETAGEHHAHELQAKKTPGWQGEAPPGHDQMMLAECGYCLLLAHSPLAADGGFFVPPGRAGPLPAPIFGLLAGHRTPPLFPHARPRAPPRDAFLSAWQGFSSARHCCA